MNGVGGKARAWGWKAVGMGGQGKKEFEGKGGNSPMAGEVKCVVRGAEVCIKKTQNVTPGELSVITETTRGSFGSARVSAMGPAMVPEMEPVKVPAKEPLKENRRCLALSVPIDH